MADRYQIFRELDHATHDAGLALSRGRQPWMFDRAAWFELAAKHTLEGKPLIIKGEAGEDKCWLFLNQNGHCAHALSNWYCLRYGVVSEGENPPLDQLVRGLRKAGVSHLRIDPTAREKQLIAQLHRRGWLTRLEQIDVSWRAKTAGMSFDEYWAARPSRLRNTIKRKDKKVALDCHIYKHFDAGLWAQVYDVFENSWKPADGIPDLTFDLFRQEAEAGTLRVGLAMHDGRPVAAQLWTIEHGTAIIHLLSYREDAKSLSAGSILSREMFRHALDQEHVAMIDFGIGDHGYKRDWMDHCVPLYSLTAYHAFSAAGIAGIVGMMGRKIGNVVQNAFPDASRTNR